MEQRTLDLWRADRNAGRLDEQLLEREVPAIQRGIIILMVSHPQARVAEGERRLTITFAAAAAWLQRYCSAVAGLACDKSAVCKALQHWRDRGVMTVTGDRVRVWWLNTERLREWFGVVPEIEADCPDYEPVRALNGVDSRVLPCPAVECRVLPLNAVDSSMSERVSEKNSDPSLTHSNQRSTDQMDRTRDSFTDHIASLPELPPAVWDTSKSDRDVVRALRAWWGEHALAERFGDDKLRVIETLCGIVSISRRKTNPQGFFCKSLQMGLKPYVWPTGAEWLRKAEKVPAYTGR